MICCIIFPLWSTGSPCCYPHLVVLLVYAHGHRGLKICRTLFAGSIHLLDGSPVIRMKALHVQYLRCIKVTPCLARGGYDLSIFGAKVTQDFPGGAGDLKILVPKSWHRDFEDFGTKILAPRFWYQDLGTKILVPRSQGRVLAVSPPYDLSILWFKWGFSLKSAPCDLI